MIVQLFIIAGYLLTLFWLGWLARRNAGQGHESFFLANRAIGPILLFLTMSASNFSAFTVLGFSGAAYRLGYAYYPIMAFGTGFMALAFVLLGIPIRQAAGKLGAITPPELIWLHFHNRPLHLAYAAVMVVFTLPYLAIQPMGAGYAFQDLLGIPYVWGASLITAVTVGYVLLGGMRADVWNNAFQDLVKLGALLAIFLSVAAALGGFTSANRQAFARFPELFGRPGAGNALPAGIWFSYMTLWFLCDPMFPHLFQRFIAARDNRSLTTTATLYPLATGLLFFLPIAIGVMSRLALPGLAGKDTDQVLPTVVAKLLPPWVGAVALIAVISALMSAMGSQLLTLSSIVVRDTRLTVLKRPRATGLVMVLLALAGLAIAYRPVAAILQVATETFTGLAVLFPVTLAMIYWPRTNAWAGFTSILVGEAMVVLYHFRLLPALGFLPVIPVAVIVTLVLVVGSLLWPAQGREPLARPSARGWHRVAAFGFVFLLGNDFWAWHQATPLWLGLPSWLWYYVGLSLLLFGLTAIAFREPKPGLRSA
jgi:solute:Na+ symporter, SSS family